jgi:cephalosporin-C deacetylase-like acetyl esterase
MIGRRSPLLSLAIVPALTLAVGSAFVSPAPRPQDALRPVVTPYRASGIYALREKAGWTVTIPTGATVHEGGLAYVIKKNNQVVIQSGTLDLSSGNGRVEVTVNEPAMLFMELTPPGGKPMAFGAAIAPTQLRPVVQRPRDFDAFWKRKVAELKAVPENPVLTPGESGKPDVDYATIRMDHVNGTNVHGQIARPRKPGKYPAMLILQWASPPYRLWSPWVTDRAAEGWIALNIQPHNVLPTEPQSYYNSLPNELKNYHTIGQQDREKNYFVEMYLRGYRAADYLSRLPDWDGKTLLVMGTSMGGQQSFAVAGLHPKVTHMIVNVPAGADLNAALHGRQAGYPFLPSNDPKSMETARYIDAINFAPRIRATSLVGMGFVDTISPPAGIWTAYNLIRGPKEAAAMVDSPHNNFATPEQQRPYTSREAEWLSALARGERVRLKKAPVLP